MPSLEGFVHEDEKLAMLERAKNFIKRKFPRVNFGKMDPIGFSKKSENETTIFKKDRSGLLANFTKKFKTSLGPEAESLIAHDNEEIRETRQSLREAEKQLQEAEKLSSEREKAAQEVQNLRTKLDQTQAKIDAQDSSLVNEAELCML